MRFAWLKRFWFSVMNAIPTWFKGVALLVVSLGLFWVYEQAYDLAKDNLPSYVGKDVTSDWFYISGDTWHRARQVVFFVWAAVVAYWMLWPSRPEDVPPANERWGRWIVAKIGEGQSQYVDERVKMEWELVKDDLLAEVEKADKDVGGRISKLESAITKLEGHVDRLRAPHP